MAAGTPARRTCAAVRMPRAAPKTCAAGSGGAARVHAGAGRGWHSRCAATLGPPTPRWVDAAPRPPAPTPARNQKSKGGQLKGG
eukprot:174704-Chlamydomonas_euryale.AAC.1